MKISALERTDNFEYLIFKVSDLRPLKESCIGSPTYKIKSF